MGMGADIQALLELFRGRVPDPQTHTWVASLAADRDAWKRGYDLFQRVRKRTLNAVERGDRFRACQYRFEEACLKSLYNETKPSAPFDARSSYSIIKNALVLARAVGVPVQDVVAIVAPEA
jgi:hypothetical protein